MSSCCDALRKFLVEATGRLSFEEVERRFSKALDENPVFSEIEKSGALGKNIIIILGGRGCGKTLMLRYVKYRSAKEGWDFKYINGTELAKIVASQGEKGLQQIVEEHDSVLSKNPTYKLVLAIDDVAEAPEVAHEYLKKEIELVRKHEGRFKLVLATQSERERTFQLLKTVLPGAPHAEMFFGEEPRRSIMESFRSSYVSRRPATLFRGATLVNLDAYWSSLRALDKVNELAEVIVKLADFYAKNVDIRSLECVNDISKCKHGLALLALSSIPKVISDQEAKIIIEYRGAEPALNGLGIAELVSRFLADLEMKKLAEEAEKMYGELKGLQVSADVDDVKEALLKSCTALKYTSLSIPVKGIVPIDVTKQAESGKQRRGPQADVIEVRARTRDGREELRYIILHNLKKDKRGYITSGSIKKLRELVQLKVPSEAEMRYLAVLIPAKRHIAAFYNALGPAEIRRKGRDVLPIFIDKLTSVEKALVHLLVKSEEKIPQELQQTVRAIIIGTMIFSLRDDTDLPQLAYLMLPHVTESASSAIS
jgi:hypothetical protein